MTSSICLPARSRIAIIGGGVSGVLTAVHLLQQTSHPLEIDLIDRRPSLGRGIAYSTPTASHLLNVPAGKMSAFPDLPHHFLDWLQLQNSAFTENSYVPRWIYGEYIQSLLQTAEANALPSIKLNRWQEEAVAIKPDGEQMTIEFASGGQLLVDRVVLAIGNFAPGNPPVADPTFYQGRRYIRSAWSGYHTQLSGDESIVLIGSGLTAVDQVIALHSQGHRGAIHIVSRRGLLPQTHQLGEPYPCHLLTAQLPRTVRALTRRIRAEIQAAEAQGYDWRSVMDSLRPATQFLWQSLPLQEKRRFLRHLRPYWETHRHRIAPPIGKQITALLQAGQLQVCAGRIEAFREDDAGVNVTIRPRQGDRSSNDGLRNDELRLTLRADRVVNCTGSECDYRKLDLPLVKNLLVSGLVRPDALRLGLDVADNGALLDALGNPSHQLYTLGSPQKGQRWETTAVAEIREQAVHLAQTLMHSIALRVSV